MNTESIHRFLTLDDKIKELEAEVKVLKTEKNALEPTIVDDLAMSEMTGVVIGNKQITVSQKNTLTIHSKENLRQFLKENYPDLLKEDIDEKALSEMLLAINAENEESDDDSDDNDEPSLTVGIPAEFEGLVSFYRLTKLKIQKAKK